MITKNKAYKLVDAMIKLRDIATDEQAAEVPELYPEWAVDVDYKVGQRVVYNEVLYKVLSAHTSQATWTPTDAPSLFAKVLVVDANVVSPWEQPDSTNPYMKGDKVTYNGKTWESTVDNNVWAPGTYGWTEMAE